MYDVPAEMIYHHFINGGLRSARVDDVIKTGRHSETCTLCEIRCKFNQLGLRLFKAFMNSAYCRHISIILMYLKTNAMFRYRRAQIRTFQDKMRLELCHQTRRLYSGPWLHKVSACNNTPDTSAMSVHEWRRKSGWGFARALSAHQWRLA